VNLKQMRELVDKATPGEWSTHRFDSESGHIHISVEDAKMQQVAFCHEDIHPKTYKADAKFIAASRTMVPELLDKVEELKQHVATLLKEREGIALAFKKLSEQTRPIKSTLPGNGI